MVRITFVGGPDTEAHESVWGREDQDGGPLVFPLDVPVEVDPARARSAGAREFFEHVIRKARSNPHFVVEDGGEMPMDDTIAEPARRKPGRPPKVKPDGDHAQ